jgi:hypothetical protein
MAGMAGDKAAKPARAGQSSLEIAQQISDVREMLSMGKQRYQICQVLAIRYGLPTRTADRRIAEARAQQVKELEQMDRKELAAQLISSAQDILTEARESKQLSNALGALGFISRLTGLEPTRN